MFRVGVRDHMMIAHSLPSPTFGPAQGVHGATYVVDVVYSRAELDADNIVVDIARAHEVLAEVLGELNYKNLDDLPRFEGIITTTEFLAKTIHGELGQRSADFFKGHLAVKLYESHVAWASYEGDV